MNTLAQPRATGQKLKVLIVEDERFIALDLKNCLTDWGYSVAELAANCREAVDIFQSQSPDLVLMDVHLGGEADGVEAAETLNQLRPVPLIYLTAQADANTVERAKKTKPAAYLLKPFDERHLQISLDLAFSNFFGNPSGEASTRPAATLANEVKLAAEVILKKDDEVFVKQNYRFVKLALSQIVCLEADGNHTFLHTTDQRLVVRIPLSTVLERLAHAPLVRVHRSFAVNLALVKNFSDTEIAVHQKTVPFSASFRGEFFKHFNVI